ncbi:MAG: hypothetical protein IT355_16200 [Gemmatimonadaceae bacterium]|nr:hypothetical protein [Gemmatimonadaceae bacterium]
MSIAASFLPEFDMEMAATRRVLAVVPAGQAEWKPHPKSFALAGLAMHIGNFPHWGLMTLTQPELDLAGSGGADSRPAFSTTEALLAAFDSGVATFRAALAGMTDEQMHAPWSLKTGPVTIFTMPRIAVLRTSVLNHMIHHRGQLTVYLRLLDVPVPDVYGPTADTKAG